MNNLFTTSYHELAFKQIRISTGHIGYYGNPGATADLVRPAL
jgi:hypothetical protein